MWSQQTIRLTARARGFHLITDEIEQQLPELSSISVGILQLFIQHTSASLTKAQVKLNVVCIELNNQDKSTQPRKGYMLS
ncbi:YjbQ family protein [Vibrio hepatarius]|nr:YjbQ family protein [Vibrio hepatarius]MBU2895789.1 YjbQ family protein [Vibrio hepatarius]